MFLGLSMSLLTQIIRQFKSGQVTYETQSWGDNLPERMKPLCGSISHGLCSGGWLGPTRLKCLVDRALSLQVVLLCLRTPKAPLRQSALLSYSVSSPLPTCSHPATLFHSDFSHLWYKESGRSWKIKKRKGEEMWDWKCKRKAVTIWTFESKKKGRKKERYNHCHFRGKRSTGHL